MASLHQLPSGLWRAQVAVHRQRRSRAFPEREQAEAWASTTEAALKLKRAAALARTEKTLASMLPRRMLEARSRLEHGPDDILRGAVPTASMSGVYFLIDKGQIVYIGQSIDVFGRISRHRRDGKVFDAFNYVLCPPDELDAVEADYIAGLLPMGNRSL